MYALLYYSDRLVTRKKTCSSLISAGIIYKLDESLENYKFEIDV